MSILKHVKVEGLWDKKPFEVNFDPQVNFLIGINGSGKNHTLESDCGTGADFEHTLALRKAASLAP
jgi:predicted ATPase